MRFAYLDMWFETLVTPGRGIEWYLERYHTMDEAIEGHARILAEWRENLCGS